MRFNIHFSKFQFKKDITFYKLYILIIRIITINYLFFIFLYSIASIKMILKNRN